VTAALLAPYERTERTARIASIVFALIVFAAIVLSARWAIAAALRPVAEMTSRAKRASESDIDRRFAEGEPNDEISELAATFDELFARLAAGLRRERSFSAEISHELRTPLAKLAGEAELALRRERTPEQYRQALAAIARETAEVARTLDALLAAARAESGGPRGVSDARDAVRAASRAHEAAAEGRGIRLELDLPSTPAPVGAETAAVERVVAPLIENGCRYAAHTVRIAVGRIDGEVRVSVADDGPGLDPSVRDRLFEPGVQGHAGDGEHSGAGLGLALARRLARALDGEVEYVDGSEGATFRARLPAV
jgi:signal transduction histidine kinase